MLPIFSNILYEVVVKYRMWDYFQLAVCLSSVATYHVVILPDREFKSSKTKKILKKLNGRLSTLFIYFFPLRDYSV